MNRMNNRTPRLAALALMLAALTACTKTDITPSDDLTNALNPSSGAPISFETEDAFTKAVIDSKADLEVEGNKFRVWSHFQGTTSGPMFTEVGTEVEYKKLNEESIPQYGWTYSPTRYWLNGTYDFAAVYPSSVSGTYAPATQGAAPTLTVNNFDVTNQDDLLVAFNTGIDGGNHPDEVALTFQHALASLNVQLRVAQETISGVLVNVIEAEVREVSFKGISKKADYIGEGWANHSTETIDVGKVLPTRIALTGDYQTILDEGILAIPQEMNENVYLYVLADITLPTGQKMMKSWNLPLSGIEECPEWEKNKKYIYKATLSAEADIEFEEPIVQPWVQGESTGVIIPR